MNIPLPIPSQHASYAGHFPGNAIVPGALLVAWIVAALQQQGIVLERISVCKFLAPVRPGEQGELTCVPKGQKQVIQLRVSGELRVRIDA